MGLGKKALLFLPRTPPILGINLIFYPPLIYGISAYPLSPTDLWHRSTGPRYQVDHPLNYRIVFDSRTTFELQDRFIFHLNPTTTTTPFTSAVPRPIRRTANSVSLVVVLDFSTDPQVTRVPRPIPGRGAVWPSLYY
jgi:hypothetical protein